MDTGDCPLVEVGTMVVVVDMEIGYTPVFDVIFVDILEVNLDMGTGDAVITGDDVDIETGVCPVLFEVNVSVGEGVVSKVEVEDRPVGAASHCENVSEVVGSVC